MEEVLFKYFVANRSRIKAGSCSSHPQQFDLGLAIDCAVILPRKAQSMAVIP